MNLKQLAFHYVDKVLLIVIVAAGTWMLIGAYSDSQEVRTVYSEVDDELDEAGDIISGLPVPEPVETKPLEKQFAAYLDVPDGSSFPDMLYRPDEVMGGQLEIKLEVGTKIYDYGEVLEVWGRPVEPPEEIAFLKSSKESVVALSKAAASRGNAIRVIPKKKGNAVGTIQFKKGTKIKFSIKVTQEGRKYLGPPVLVSLDGGRGTVKLTFHRNPDSVGIGTDKYRIERREKGADTFNAIHTMDAPAEDRKAPEPRKPAAPEGPGAGEHEEPGEEEPAEPPPPGPGEGPVILGAGAGGGEEAPAGEGPPAPAATEEPEFKLSSYIDATVEPRRVYEYRVTAISTTTAKLPEPIEKSCEPKEIKTLDELEAQLTSVMGSTATFTITRWVEGTPVQKRFFLRRGREIGGMKRVQVGDDPRRRRIDFSIGSMLLDFGTSVKWQYVEVRRRERVDGRFEVIERKELKAKDTPWAVVYDTERGSRLFWLEEARNIDKTEETPE